MSAEAGGVERRSSSVAVPAIFAADRTADGPGVGAAVHESLAQAADVLSVSGAAVALVDAGRLTYLASPVEAIAAVERRAVQRPGSPWAAAATTRQPATTLGSWRCPTGPAVRRSTEQG